MAIIWDALEPVELDPALLLDPLDMATVLRPLVLPVDIFPNIELLEEAAAAAGPSFNEEDAPK